MHLCAPAPRVHSEANMNTVEVVAHRGNSLNFPENTLASIRSAVELGVEAVEIDLRTTRDNQLVLMHDETVDRTTSGQGQLSRLSLPELRALDAGSWKSPQFAPEGVPTLEQATRALGTETRLFAEIKLGPMAEEIARIADASGIRERLTLLCWGRRPEDIADGHRWLPDVSILELGDAPQRFDAAFFTARRSAGLSGFDYKFKTLTPDFARAAREEGMSLYTWTVNRREDMLRAIDMDLTGITTDDPALLLGLI